jgi:hypothetical protein
MTKSILRSFVIFFVCLVALAQSNSVIIEIESCECEESVPFSTNPFCPSLINQQIEFKQEGLISVAKVLNR